MFARPRKTTTPPDPRTDFDQIGTILVVLWTMLPIAAFRAAKAVDPAIPPPPSLDTIDPNSAPWWELTVLPEIGESGALQIIAYRTATSSDETGRPRRFSRVADLELVRGIGPKTVARIAPYVRFGD